jgi:hypothetical protein
MSFDRQDGRLVAKGVLVVGVCAVTMMSVAGILGLAWRVFWMAAGG